MNPLGTILAVVVVVTAILHLLWPGWQGMFRGYVGMQNIDWIVLLLLGIATLAEDVLAARRVRRRERTDLH